MVEQDDWLLFAVLILFHQSESAIPNNIDGALRVASQQKNRLSGLQEDNTKTAEVLEGGG